jgi:hypothetical protein
MLVYFLVHGSRNKVGRVDRGACNNLEKRIPDCNPGAGAERCVAIHLALDLKLLPPRQRRRRPNTEIFILPL